MKSITCTQCGFVSWAAGGGRCKSCGQPLPVTQPAYQSAPQAAWEPQGSHGSGEHQPGAQRSGEGHGPQGSWEQHGPQGSWEQHDPQGQWEGQGQQEEGHWEQPGGPYYSSGAPAKKSQGMATASLVLGVIGIFTFGLLAVGAIVGLILGIVALRRTSREPSVYGGRGIAISGIATNALGVLSILPLAIVLAIAVPNLLAARRAANEASAISGLRDIIVAQSTYASTTGAGGFGTLAELREGGLLDKELADGFRSGYRFKVVAYEGGCEARAMPMTYGQSGVRSFYASCEEGGVRGADKKGGLAEDTDPLLGAPAFGGPESTFDPTLRAVPPDPLLIPGR